MGNYSDVEIYLVNIEKNLNEIRDSNKNTNGKRFFIEYEEKMEEYKKRFSSFEEEIGELDSHVTQLKGYIEEGSF
ncbi:hypothetical protein RAK27_19375 [Carnobacterium maltaromaticum]|uniref:LXG domain-containing protein n=1 Tax=Carnobacterium maltaromaticum TaxID=2751 RepID=A0AAW9JZR8_CARML|nr:hypothetical protein [Carnobacterium maltaromaticum]MDZ5760809.1 hypothetical protein [Carnobacterium maltaromaticum]